MSRHRPPSVDAGRFLFAFIDEEAKYQSVRMRHGLAGHREPPMLHRCVDGVHVIELHAPAVHRIEYRFELANSKGEISLVTDPLNRLTVRDPFAQKSVIASAEYSPPPYVSEPPAAVKGTLEELSIAGPLGKPWPAWIWSPPAAKREMPLPVILFLDGGDWLEIAGAQSILANLVARDEIQQCRAVFMKPASRNEECAANPRTARFLAEDLPRSLAERFPWPEKQANRIAVGVSLGALCLLHAHFAHSHAFGGLILQSGAFFQPRSDPMELEFSHFDRIASFVAQALHDTNSNVARIPVHMTCGAGEENIVNNHIMAEALTQQGFPLTFHEQPDAHNWTCWRDSIGTGLIRLLQ